MSKIKLFKPKYNRIIYTIYLLSSDQHLITNKIKVNKIGILRITFIYSGLIKLTFNLPTILLVKQSIGIFVNNLC